MPRKHFLQCPNRKQATYYHFLMRPGSKVEPMRRESDYIFDLENHQKKTNEAAEKRLKE